MSRASFVIAAAALALMSLPVGEASAAAYCAYAGGGRGGSYENCGFYTWEQCLENVRGLGGFCMVNPHKAAAWGHPSVPPGYKQRRHRHANRY